MPIDDILKRLYAAVPGGVGLGGAPAYEHQQVLLAQAQQTADWAQQQQQQMLTMAQARPELFDKNVLLQSIMQQSSMQNDPQPNPPLHIRAREMFLKRVGGIRAEAKLGLNDFLQCHIYNEMVYIFFLLNGKEGVVSEPIDLFPSDALITQFRLVMM